MDSIPGREDSLEKGMAIDYSVLAWEIPGIEEPGGLQSVGLQRVRHDWEADVVAFPVQYKTLPNTVEKDTDISVFMVIPF